MNCEFLFYFICFVLLIYIFNLYLLYSLEVLWIEESEREICMWNICRSAELLILFCVIC